MDWAVVGCCGAGLGIKFCGIDDSIYSWHILLNSDWKSPVGAGPLAMPEALRTSGKHLQSPSFLFARRTAAEFLANDFIRTVRLYGSQHLDADGTRHQIGNLQACRV